MSRIKSIFLIFFTASLLFWSCDYGQLGGADKTNTYYSGDTLFEERMSFLAGLWYSRDPGIGLLDSYRIRKWSDITAADKTKAQALFSGTGFDVNNPQTYCEQDFPQDSDYVLLFDDTVYGQEYDDSGAGENWGFCYMGLVRAINIFNGDKKRGAIIIEYFEGADPFWLAWEGLLPGEKPFYGIYYKVIDPDTVQMANAIDQVALNEGRSYHLEQRTLNEAATKFDAENEAEFIIWGVVFPYARVK